MKFSQAQLNTALPIVVLQVPPSVWAQTWADRPRETLALGLRRLSDTDLADASSAADAEARRLHPHAEETDGLWVEAYNRRLVKLAVGRALCSPESADVGWWDYPDFLAPKALEDAGAVWLYNELISASTATSMLAVEDNGPALLAELADAWHRVVALPLARRQLVLRHLRAAIDVVEAG